MKDLFIFDMDGVIINSEPIYLKANIKYFKKYGFEVSEDEYAGFVGMSAEKMWQKIKDKYSLKEDLSFLVKANNDYTLDVFSKEKNLQAIDGIYDLLAELKSKNIKIAIGSSSSLRMIELITKRLEIEKYFDFFQSGEFVENGKPEPDIFLKIAEHFNVKPTKAVVLEDSFNGVTAAKKAGMYCIAYNNTDSGYQDLSAADMKLDNFSSESINRILAVLDN